ncbi:DUF2509 family protein, partial [Escherichia coli]
KMHSWQTQPAVQCSQYAGTDAQVCLRLLADNEALLIAGYEGVSLWRTGEVIDGNYRREASPEGGLLSWQLYRRRAGNCRTG